MSEIDHPPSVQVELCVEVPRACSMIQHHFKDIMILHYLHYVHYTIAPRE